MPRDVIPDADRRTILSQDRPRSDIRHPQATRVRVPGAKSHHTGESAGAIQAIRNRGISVRAECRGRDDLRSPYRIGFSVQYDVLL